MRAAEPHEHSPPGLAVGGAGGEASITFSCSQTPRGCKQFYQPRPWKPHQLSSSEPGPHKQLVEKGAGLVSWRLLGREIAGSWFRPLFSGSCPFLAAWPSVYQVLFFRPIVRSSVQLALLESDVSGHRLKKSL